MAQFTIEEVLQATHGSATKQKNIKFSSVSTDTRTIEKDSLFVALEGQSFDGHDFLRNAVDQGAIGCIVKKGKAIDDVLCIEVTDTLLAYQQLANFHRKRFSIPVVAITGSSGKTTTKEMVAAVLETTYRVLKTEKNFNNEIGLPKTLLDLTPDHEACVVEMGMRGLGQIAELAAIAEPTVAVVTNVGTSHIELLGSKEAISQAKGELIEALDSDGVAILNEDDEYVRSMVELTDAKIITYGIQSEATVKGIQIRYKKDGVKFTCRCFDEIFDVFLPMIGEHNVYDCLAAISVGRTLGVKPSVKMVKAFSIFKGIPMRQEIVRFQDFVVLNDAYNANPDSMAEAIKALGQLEAKRKIAILGDMLELGNHSQTSHEAIGKLLQEEDFQVVITIGKDSGFISKMATKCGIEKVYHCNNHKEAGRLYMQLKEKGDAVLLKGSRGLQMENVLPFLVD